MAYLIAVVLYSLVAIGGLLALMFTRWRWWRRVHEPLVPGEFVGHRPVGYVAGMLFTWLGHAALLVTMVLTAEDLASGSPTYATGPGFGIALQAYLVALYCVELSVRMQARKSASSRGG